MNVVKTSSDYTIFTDYDMYTDNPIVDYEHVAIISTKNKYNFGNETHSSIGQFLSNMICEMGLEYNDYYTKFRPITSRLKRDVITPGYTFWDFMYDLESDDDMAIDEAFQRLENAGFIYKTFSVGQDGALKLCDTDQYDGIIYITPGLYKSTGNKLSNVWKGRATDIILEEINELSQWLCGEVYYVKIIDNTTDDYLDSVCGIYGDTYLSEIVEEFMRSYPSDWE